MGIVAFCPNGHRVKVKDELAGRKGICPTCAARFRIPLETPQSAPQHGLDDATGLPLARIVSLDPLVAVGLPTAVADESSGPGDDVPDFAPVGAESGGDDHESGSSGVSEPLFAETAASYEALDERPDLEWCVAVAGGSPSEPLGAAAMRAWLDSGAASADHLVWRSDWPDWRPLADVFPDAMPPEPPGWP